MYVTARVLGMLIGWALVRHPAGGVIGFLLGWAIDAGWFRSASNERPAPNRPSVSDDPYRLLGVRRDAPMSDIDRAWRKAMSKVHPDRFARADAATRAKAEARARAVNAAYDAIVAERRGAA
ncbi:MAG: DnaJ domain-containing protein [Aquimonas sp.]|nr:DnaJ domain-containing protein [Aquimonas sp.]